MKPANLLGGAWIPIPGQSLQSHNPAHPDRVVWSGAPDARHVEQACTAARAAADAWADWPFERRAEVLRQVQRIAKSRESELAATIRDEVGKPMWDALAEAQLIASKIDITLDPTGSMQRVSGFHVPVSPSREGRCWFRPHGVMAVLGPFNFPAHLPNGHIAPALAMGNSIIFKPSDKAPATGQLLTEIYHEALSAAGAPAGVFNLVQGGADVATSLVTHTEPDGILFTGSWSVGRRITQANLDRPGRILALEMGGNNAAVVMPDADLAQAVVECVRSAFVTAGQRCTCTRRLIVHRDVAPRVLPALCKAASSLIIGDPAAAHPVFMGPLISQPARDSVLHAQAEMIRAGARALVPCTAPDIEGWFLAPGVLQVGRFVAEVTAPGEHPGADVEVFGPLLRVCVVDSLADAIAQTNATAFGLAASIFTRDSAAIDRFTQRVRAGCVNVNTGTAGASSKLPFGGLGLSGNHRPAGAFSLDYCAYPVAGMTETGNASTLNPGMTFDPAWL